MKADRKKGCKRGGGKAEEKKRGGNGRKSKKAVWSGIATGHYWRFSMVKKVQGQL